MAARLFNFPHNTKPDFATGRHAVCLFRFVIGRIDMSPEQFKIQIAEHDIDDLRARLRQSRWPSPVDASNWDAGSDAVYLRGLMEYWGTEYNWREREALLNDFDHFVSTVQGTQIHFIKALGQGKQRIPLLLMQGWPSSFVQMLEIIPMLTEARSDGSPSFDVIAASLPGYPFTTFPQHSGMSFSRIADLMTELMVEHLGYEQFAARGSDQGGLVQQQIALKYPERVIGLHRSGITPFANPLPSDLSPAEREYQQKVAAWAQLETSYARLQTLRPETLTPAFSDSPLALASWYLEKFQRWGDCRDGFEQTFGRDRLLDNLSLHWFSGSGAASIRLYRESGRDPGVAGKVTVPTAIMMPLHDAVTVPAPREWAERSFNVQRWTIMERGGHFPEWERPYEVAQDIRHFFMDLLH
jgi:pimeloyl-ACP methyl ester carboxylesterase